MRDVEFPYPTINHQKPTGNEKFDLRQKKVFDLLFNYRQTVTPYIFTNIQLIYDPGDPRILLSRIQQHLSSVLLRSLYIRNGIVDSFNSKNMVTLFANLKSFLEVPAVLGYMLYLLNRKAPPGEILKQLTSLVMGNKDAGDLTVGTEEAVNVLTMFNKLKEILEEMRKKSSHVEATEIDTVMSNFYGAVCNAVHPNYDAHDVTGIFEPDKERWRGLHPNEVKNRLVSESEWYTPPLIMAMSMIEFLAQSIMEHDSVRSFANLTNPLYFD